MNEQVKKYVDPVKAFWKKQSKKNKRIFFIVLGCVLLVSVGISVILNLPDYSVLYPGLDRTEAAEVMTALDKRGVNYRESNGTIMVPKEKEDSLRMDLSNEGHPRTAPNYDFFLDNIDIMTTDMEKKIIREYQLESKLVAVIKNIECISDATVTFTIPDNDGYVLSSKDKEKSKASVTLSIVPGKELTNAQVNGIKHLVANSVPSLEEDGVVIVNNATGSELSGGDLSQMDLANVRLDIEKQVESGIVGNVMDILTPIFGKDNVKVAAKSTMDMNKKIEEIITYIPSEDNKGVISKEEHESEQERGDNEDGGVPGTDSNTQTPSYPGVSVDGDTLYVKSKDNYEYLVSKVTEQIQHDAGELKDLTVSVAINKDSMTQEQRTELSKLVANASSVTAEKVAIYNAAFPDPDIGMAGPDPDGNPSVFGDMNLILIASAAFAVLLMFILVLMLLGHSRKKKLRLLTAAMNAQSEAPVLPEEEAETFIPELVVKETRTQALTKEIQDFASHNPEISAQLIRTWLKGDDRDG